MPNFATARLITDLYHNLFRRSPVNRATHEYSADGTMHYESEAMLFTVRFRAHYIPAEVDNKNLSDEERQEHWERENTTYGSIHFILTGPSYVSVWTTGLVQEDAHSIPLEQWDNVSNHDSCWRSDGIQTPLWVAMAAVVDECQAHVPEELRRPMRELNPEADLGGCDSQKMEIVHVRYHSGDRVSGRRYKLTHFEPSRYCVGVTEKRRKE